MSYQQLPNLKNTKRCPRCGVWYLYTYDKHTDCVENLRDYSTHTKDVVELTSGKIGYRITKGFNTVKGNRL